MDGAVVHTSVMCLLKIIRCSVSREAGSLVLIIVQGSYILVTLGFEVNRSFIGLIKYSFVQDPKRKVHKPMKATLRLEIERLSNDDHEADCISECGSFGNGSYDADSRSIGGASLSGRSTQGLEFTKALYNGHQKGSPVHRELHSSSGSSLELGRSEVRCRNIQQSSSFKYPM